MENRVILATPTIFAWVAPEPAVAAAAAALLARAAPERASSR